MRLSKKMNLSAIVCSSCVALLLLSGAFFETIANQFPSKPITIIVPWAAGGGGDVITRILAKGMETNLNVPLVIKNITGAGSITGMTTLWREKPDGYTIGMNYAQHTCSGQLYEKEVQYDARSFSMIGQFGWVYYMLVVPKGSPYGDVLEFKKAERPVRFCVTSFNSNEAVTALALGEELGIDVRLVSGYGGAAPSILGAMKGECDAVQFGTPLKPYIEKGDLFPLLVYAKERREEYPNVVSLGERGLSDELRFLSTLNYILWAPPGVPDGIRTTLQRAMKDGVKKVREELKTRLLVPDVLVDNDAKKLIEDVFETFSKAKKLVDDYKAK